MPEYKYYIEGIEVHPVNERGYKFKWSKKEDIIFLRCKSDNKFIIANDIANGYTDYDFLKTINDGNHSRISKYDNLDFRIIEIFSKKAPEEFWRGEFKVTDCKFNVHRKQVEFTATVKDNYTEFYENSDNDINLMTIMDRWPIDISYYSYLVFYPTLTLDEAPAGGLYSLWKLLYWDGDAGEEHNVYDSQQNGCASYYIYASEQIILPKEVEPAGDDWVEITSTDKTITWGRPWDTEAHFTTPTASIMEIKTIGLITDSLPEPSEGYKLVVRATLSIRPTISIVNSYSYRYALQSQAHINCIKLKSI